MLHSQALWSIYLVNTEFRNFTLWTQLRGKY